MFNVLMFVQNEKMIFMLFIMNKTELNWIELLFLKMIYWTIDNWPMSVFKFGAIVPPPPPVWSCVTPLFPFATLDFPKRSSSTCVLETLNGYPCELSASGMRLLHMFSDCNLRLSCPWQFTTDTWDLFSKINSPWVVLTQVFVGVKLPYLWWPYLLAIV